MDALRPPSSYRLTLAVTWLTLASNLGCLAQELNDDQSSCFSSSSLVGAVLGTFFSTLAALAIGFIFWWISCRHRYNQDEDKRQKGRQPAANVESGVGFDNPCFEEHPNSDGVDGAKSRDHGHKVMTIISVLPVQSDLTDVTK